MRILRRVPLALALSFLCVQLVSAQTESKPLSAGPGGQFDASVCDDPRIAIDAAQENATPFYDPVIGAANNTLLDVLEALAEKDDNYNIDRAGACLHAPGEVFLVPNGVVGEVLQLMAEIAVNGNGGGNGGSNSGNGNRLSGGTSASGGNPNGGGPPAGGYSIPTPGPPVPAGAANPCLPAGPGGYNFCDNAKGTRLPAGCTCPNNQPSVQTRTQSQQQPTQTLHGQVTKDDPCTHTLSTTRNQITLNNAQDLSKMIFDNYNHAKPIEIVKVANRTNTYVVILAGTEIGSGQANSLVNPFQPLLNLYQQIFQQTFNGRLETVTQNLGDLLSQKAVMNSALSVLNLEVRSAQGNTTAYQLDALAAMAQQIPNGSNIIFAGHSVGGMTAENLLNNPSFARFYNPIELVTYGSPITQADNTSGSIRYVRFASPNDVVPLTTPATWISKASQWIHVTNPGDNPALGQFFTPTGVNVIGLLQAVVNGAANAHLAYPSSTDLAQYGVLSGTKNTSTTLVLDSTQDHCYSAPDFTATPAP